MSCHRMRARLWPAMAAVVLLIVPAAAVADPLYGRNLAPIPALIGFPTLRHAGALESGQFSTEVVTSVANYYATGSNAQEQVNFDGETQRIAPRLRFGLGSGWEIEAEFPWQNQDGGELDQLIDDWHDLWGLPDGNRDEVARDLYNVSYQGPGASFSFTDGDSGWGDASLAVVGELYRTEGRVISARVGAKFATGDEDDLLGSGSEDYYISFNFTGEHASELPLLWHGQVGYLRAGDADVLGDIQEQDLWFAGIGMEWRHWRSLHLKLQVDSHAAVADSQRKELGDTSVQLTAGVTWLINENWEFDASFSEDIAVATAPDFVVHAALRYRPPVAP